MKEYFFTCPPKVPVEPNRCGIVEGNIPIDNKAELIIVPPKMNAYFTCFVNR